MIQSYLLTLEPMEPYFFGNEKTFSFDPKSPADNRYFIKSERLPMQTTILGALRYLLMPMKKESYRYSNLEQMRNSAIIGPASFSMDGPEQDFGVIRQISPVFLMNNGQKFVRTPFDHCVKADRKHYTPLCDCETVMTERGEQLYFKDFSAKTGIPDSYMNVQSGELVEAEEIFHGIVRTGINRGRTERGFYKKQFIRMERGWTFGAYASLDLDILETDPDAKAALSAMMKGTTVFLGQNKSAFSVRLLPEEDTLAQTVGKLLRPDVLYCMGDACVDGDVYARCRFAVSQTRDYRAYQTVFSRNPDTSYTGSVRKNARLYKMLRAGSILIPDLSRETLAYFRKEQLLKIGFNVTVLNLEDQET